MTLNATNDDGSDEEVKTDYITVENPNVDLTISGLVNTVPGSAVFAGENNTVRVMNIKNLGTDTANNIVVSVYASDVSSTIPVATYTIPSLAGGATTTINFVDPLSDP